MVNVEIGLDQFFQPLNSPVANTGNFTSGIDFATENDRNTVSLYHITQLPWVDMVDAATAVIDLSKGNRQRITLGGSRTLVVINGVIGKTFILRVQQDNGGSRLLTWFNTILWAGGGVPTLTTTGNKADEFGFIITGVNTYDGFIIGLNI